MSDDRLKELRDELLRALEDYNADESMRAMASVLTTVVIGCTKDRDQARESRPRRSAQDDKWSFCLTVGTLCPANQEKQ
jgi:hypothetical protein